MPDVDTYRTTYKVDKDKTIDGKTVAGYVSTCDHCFSCEDEATGTDKLNTWIDGKTKLKFYPHITDVAGGALPYQFQARSTYFVGDDGSETQAVNVDVDGNFNYGTNNPDWEDGGGFYFKKRTPQFFFSQHPDSSGKKICNYLVEVDWEASLDNQILNWFRGGPDRMAFLVVNRHTDRKASNDASFPTSNGPQTPIQQYYHFLSNSGTVGGSGVTGEGLSTQSLSGKFFFQAKTFDSWWIEFYEYARRGYNQSWAKSRENNQKEENLLRVEYSNMDDDSQWGSVEPNHYGPGKATPAINWSKTDNDNDLLYNFSTGYTNAQRDAAGDHFVDESVQKPNTPLPELRAMGITTRPTTPTYEAGPIGAYSNSDLKYNQLGGPGSDVFWTTYEVPPTLGWNSCYDLNLGVADPINSDWIAGNAEDPELNDASKHNSVTVTLKKHLIVDPAFIDIPSEDSGLTNKGVTFAPYLESESTLTFPYSANDRLTDMKVGSRSYALGEMKNDRLSKSFASAEAGADSITLPGELLTSSGPVEA